MYEFHLEKRLQSLDSDLHERTKSSISVLHKMLEKYLLWFPDFTDHSYLHSMDVLDFSNMILKDQIQLLSAAECYTYIMSCYLHDIGMGLSRNDYEEFVKQIDLTEYMKENPDASEPSIIRDFHNELSGIFIRKYNDLFDIPSEEFTFAIIQISRGHRKVDLYDEKEYPILHTEKGIIRTPFLGALIRLADEIDVGAERNPELLFDTSKLTKQKDIDAFGINESIKRVEVGEKEIILHTKPKEERFIELISQCADKIQQTLDYCRDVSEKRSDLTIALKKVLIKSMDNE